MYTCLRSGGCVPIMVLNRYFFVNGKNLESIGIKVEYLVTDSGNGRKT